MENITTRTVREIALESPATTRVFESYKIDYCCGGRKNFIDACELAGADPASVQKDLETVLAAKSVDDSQHVWADDDWMVKRQETNPHTGDGKGQ